MQVLLMIIYAMLVLTALVVVHEFGHYIAAKKNGIKVAEFSIGFGPRLIKWHRGETEFSFRPILFGGYVRFADDIESEGPPKPGDFRAASLKARAITSAAGPVMNVIVAFALAVVMLLITPEVQGVRLVHVEPGMPAEEAGLQEGDIIRQLNGVDMDFYAQALTEYQSVPRGDTVHVEGVRDGKPFETDVHIDSSDPEAMLGISMEPSPYNFFEACALSFKWLGQQTAEIFKALGNLFFRWQGIEQMSGIVGTTVVVGNVIQYGTLGLVLMLIALISINLAIINLLPIPALDGGKLLLFGIEAIRKRPVPERAEAIMNTIGMTAIMGLAIFLVFQDVSRLIP